VRLIHITDLHLTSLAHLGWRDLRGKQWLGYQSWLRNRQYRHLRANLDRLMQAVTAQNPDLLCITGDLVHIAHADELRAAAQWLGALDLADRIVLIPGNHDLYHPAAWAVLAEQWRSWFRWPEDANLCAPRTAWPLTIKSGGVSIDCLNSSIPMPWYSAQGELGSGQLNRLESMPTGQQGPRVLLLHHPPLSPREDPSISRRKALRDSNALRPLLGQYDFVLHGHTHKNTVLNAANTRIYGTASASASNASFRQFDLEQVDNRWQITMQLNQLANSRISQISDQTWIRDGTQEKGRQSPDPGQETGSTPLQ